MKQTHLVFIMVLMTLAPAVFAQDRRGDRREGPSILSSPNHYDTLGLPVGQRPPPGEIDRIVRRLRIQFHPDRGAGNAEILDRILTAANALSDERNRAAYDIEIGLRGRAADAQPARPQPRTSPEQNRGSNPFDFGHAPRSAQRIDEARVSTILADLRLESDLSRYIDRLIMEANPLSVDPNFSEALTRLVREEAERRAVGETPARARTWRNLGGILNSNPYRGFENMSPLDLSIRMSNLSLPAEVKTLIQLMAMEKLPNPDSSGNRLKHAALVISHLRVAQSEIMRSPLLVKLMDTLTISELLFSGPRLAHEQQWGQLYTRNFLDRLVEYRIFSEDGNQRIVRELVIQTEIFGSDGWSQVTDGRSASEAEARIREILQQYPRMWDAYERDLVGSIISREARTLGRNVHRLERFLSVLRSERASSASAQSTNTEQQARQERQERARPRTWRERAASASGAFGNLFRRGDKCEATFTN